MLGIAPPTSPEKNLRCSNAPSAISQCDGRSSESPHPELEQGSRVKSWHNPHGSRSLPYSTRIRTNIATPPRIVTGQAPDVSCKLAGLLPCQGTHWVVVSCGPESLRYNLGVYCR